MLRTQNLSVKLKNSQDYIFKEISFSLTQGNIYTITGSNGTGKTILLKSLTGLLNNTIFDISGQVEIGEKNIFKLSENELRNIRKHKIRYVFQDEANAFDPLKKFNYYFKNGIIKNSGRIDTVFNQLLLSPPEKYLNSYPYEVSTGQIQRIGFALAILSDPEIVILDEPTSAIDPINANLYKIILHEYINNKQKSVLLVTHDFTFAQKVSDYMAILNEQGLSPFQKTG